MRIAVLFVLMSAAFAQNVKTVQHVSDGTFHELFLAAPTCKLAAVSPSQPALLSCRKELLKAKSKAMDNCQGKSDEQKGACGLVLKLLDTEHELLLADLSSRLP